MMTSRYQLALRALLFSDRSGQELMFSRVSGQCGIGTRCQRRHEAPIITVSTSARSAHYHGVLGFALAARASPWRLGLRPGGSGFALAARRQETKNISRRETSNTKYHHGVSVNLGKFFGIGKIASFHLTNLFFLYFEHEMIT